MLDQAATSAAARQDSKQCCDSSERLKQLRNLGYAGRLHHRRALLAVGKAGGFVLVGIHTTELFAVGIINGDQPVMMLAAAVFIKGGLFVFRTALGWSLGHGAILLVFPMMPHYRKQRTVSQVPQETLAGYLPDR